MSFEEYARKYVPFVETALDDYLPPETDPPGIIHKAMRYSVMGGGKRLRALLAIAGCEAVGGNIHQLPPLLVAIESIHAYSLIHDDLPCMDDDDYRRGKLTNHKVFGEGIAVLAGDALLTLGFHLISRLPELGVSTKVTLQLVSELSGASGTYGLIGGQVVDLESEGKEIAEETLRYIHTHKTGALFRAALRSGALVGGADALQLEMIDTFAEEFGLAFQITDDILDVIGDVSKLGKAVGSDVRQAKATYVSMYGLEEAKRLAAESVKRAEKAIAPLGDRAIPLVDMAQYILVRDH